MAHMVKNLPTMQETWVQSLRLYAGGALQGSPVWQALSGHKRRSHVVFLQLPRDSRITMGNTGFLLCWPREIQSSIRVARESWGLRSSHCRAKETSSRLVSKGSKGLRSPFESRRAPLGAHFVA